MTPPPDVAARLQAIPLGTSTGCAAGRRYVTTRSQYNQGKSTKLVAEELGGSDYISLDFYALTSGDRLFPCEMPARKVIAFLRSYRVSDDKRRSGRKCAQTR